MVIQGPITRVTPDLVTVGVVTLVTVGVVTLVTKDVVTLVKACVVTLVITGLVTLATAGVVTLRVTSHPSPGSSTRREQGPPANSLHQLPFMLEAGSCGS